MLSCSIHPSLHPSFLCVTLNVVAFSAGFCLNPLANHLDWPPAVGSLLGVDMIGPVFGRAT